MATSHREKQTSEEFGTAVADTAQDTARAAKKMAGNVAEEAGSFVGKAAEKAKEAASYVGAKAERATEAVGAGMESLGGAIRQHEPQTGALHNAGECVADKLEGAGQYLEEHGLKGIADDVTNLIRRNPIPALLIGVGVGVLLARMLRR